MTVRQPLVLGADGLPQQLQAGDTVGAFTTGLATIPFGSTPTDEMVTTVATTAITANSVVLLMPDPNGTADNTGDEHMVEGFALNVQNIIAGTSFDIRMTCADQFGLTGQWGVRWSING